MTGKVLTEVDGHQLQLSNLDKVFYPETGFTKGQMIDYYSRVAPYMVPHLEDRPITLKRYPDGVEGEYFYEKECPSHHPDWLKTGRVASSGKRGYVDFCLVEEEAALVWIANLASIEIHTLLSRYPDVRTPRFAVFDLDPGHPAGILDCAWTALRLKEVLGGLGLECFPKTSGKKGIHVCLPLNTEVGFERTKSFANAVAMMLEKEYPERIVANMKKEKRKGKVLIDWSQNTEHKSTVCVYSLRADRRPFVSTPLSWKELEQLTAGGAESAFYFEARDVLERTEDRGDLFEPVLKLKQGLPAGKPPPQ